ncbi:uncharacterized protein NEMAJ01_1901 [Nematocida major]|uniref:uncharacterized protein n=1 Tax=Nematocida major TaxID=1912982 RepID=UPI00200773C1|nr:uncharacterized protein NEMAJ01_1901 [Nematocida major]KAH9387005.1 hypothetical protein NEMAJ01_1901 [Nematocida major]
MRRSEPKNPCAVIAAVEVPLSYFPGFIQISVNQEKLYKTFMETEQKITIDLKEVRVVISVEDLLEALEERQKYLANEGQKSIGDNEYSYFRWVLNKCVSLEGVNGEFTRQDQALIEDALNTHLGRILKLYDNPNIVGFRKAILCALDSSEPASTEKSLHEECIRVIRENLQKDSINQRTTFIKEVKAGASQIVLEMRKIKGKTGINQNEYNLFMERHMRMYNSYLELKDFDALKACICDMTVKYVEKTNSAPNAIAYSIEKLLTRMFGQASFLEIGMFLLMGKRGFYSKPNRLEKLKTGLQNHEEHLIVSIAYHLDRISRWYHVYYNVILVHDVGSILTKRIIPDHLVVREDSNPTGARIFCDRIDTDLLYLLFNTLSYDELYDCGIEYEGETPKKMASGDYNRNFVLKRIEDRMKGDPNKKMILNELMQMSSFEKKCILSDVQEYANILGVKLALFEKKPHKPYNLKKKLSMIATVILCLVLGHIISRILGYAIEKAEIIYNYFG